MAGRFYVIVVDHDRKVWSVHGPMTDDLNWGVAVIDARQNGRDVQLAGGLELTSKSIAETEAREAYGGYEVVRSALSTALVRTV